MSWNNTKYQYFAALWVNIMTISYGTSLGWSSSALLILESVDSPLNTGPVTKEEASWIGSLLCIGGLAGNFFFGWIVDKIGRKPSFLLTGIPQIISWLLIIIAKYPIYLYISRILCGFASGGVFLLVPIYVTEISEDIIRGRLGSFLILTANMGILFSFIIGNYLSFHIIPYVLLSLPVIFIIGMIFLPETPYYLIRNGYDEKAEHSIKFFRNDWNESSCNIKAIMEVLKHNSISKTKNEVDNSISLKDITNPIARKSLLISLTLFAITQFCGCFAIINYIGPIFAESGSNLSPTMSAMIVGAIQLLGAYISTLLVERAGRRFLFSGSSFAAGIGLIFLGLYSCLQEHGFDMSDFGWMPVASLSFTILVASFGVLTLPFVISTEIMPPKILSIGVTICLTFSWVLAFLLVKYLYVLTNLLQFYGCMFMFAACCFLGGTFVLLCVPETKGKSIDDILKMLA